VRVLLDQGTPVPLREFLARHEITTAYERGWSTFKNGDLLDAAELAGFDVLITTDANLKYQQNLGSRRIAVVVLMSTSWPRIQQVIAAVVDTVESASVGTYVEVQIP
jgi:hypothetical protein